MPSRLVHVGQWVTFAVVRRMWPTEVTTVERFSLQICEFYQDEHAGLAFKSEDMPIDTLRRLPGFIEAPPVK